MKKKNNNTAAEIGVKLVFEGDANGTRSSPALGPERPDSSTLWPGSCSHYSCCCC